MHDPVHLGTSLVLIYCIVTTSGLLEIALDFSFGYFDLQPTDFNLLLFATCLESEPHMMIKKSLFCIFLSQKLSGEMRKFQKKERSPPLENNIRLRI